MWKIQIYELNYLLWYYWYYSRTRTSKEVADLNEYWGLSWISLIYKFNTITYIIQSYTDLDEYLGLWRTSLIYIIIYNLSHRGISAFADQNII